MKVGVLLHVYHLDTEGWERLVWGDPETDSLGTGTKLIECLLDVPVSDAVDAIVYSGPSTKDGLNEGEYTKQFILDRVDRLAEFPRLRAKLDVLKPAEYSLLLGRLRSIQTGPVIKNTAAEMQMAATYFKKQAAGKVIQIAAAMHAPRCLRNQTAARFHGLIDKQQLWYVAASDVSYMGYSPDDVVIAEPIHRKDNDMYGFHPSWVEVTKKYSYVSFENKKEVLQQIDAVMSAALAKQSDTTEVVN